MHDVGARETRTRSGLHAEGKWRRARCLDLLSKLDQVIKGRIGGERLETFLAEEGRVVENRRLRVSLHEEAVEGAANGAEIEERLRILSFHRRFEAVGRNPKRQDGEPMRRAAQHDEGGEEPVEPRKVQAFAAANDEKHQEWNRQKGEPEEKVREKVQPGVAALLRVDDPPKLAALL